MRESGVESEINNIMFQRNLETNDVLGKDVSHSFINKGKGRSDVMLAFGNRQNRQCVVVVDA